MRALALALAAAALAACADPPAQVTVDGYTGAADLGALDSYVIAGPRTAIVVDGQGSVDDAMQVVAMLQRRDLIPIAAFVTRIDPAREVGLATLRLAYPELPIYAPPALAAAAPPLTAYPDATIDVDGATVALAPLTSATGEPAVALRVPAADAAIIGDTLADDIWLAARAGWLATDPPATRYYPGRGAFPRAAAALAPAPAALLAATAGPSPRGSDRCSGARPSTPDTRAAAR
ncbi:MAG: hypothetical protein JNK64_24440 [Myxococcales bacterium]|nr:hypothetical protein [Myxococcales bacterium]